MGEIPIHFAGRATHPTVWDFGDLQASDLCTCLTHSTGPIICTCVPSSGPAFLPAGGSFQGVHRSHLHDHHGTPAIRAKKGSCDFLQSENCPNSNFKLLSPEKSVATWGDERHNDVSVQICWPLSRPFFLQPGGQTLSCYHSCHALQLLGGQSCLLLHALWCEVTDTPRRGGSLGMYGRKLWRKTSKTPKPGQP